MKNTKYMAPAIEVTKLNLDSELLAMSVLGEGIENALPGIADEVAGGDIEALTKDLGDDMVWGDLW